MSLSEQINEMEERIEEFESGEAYKVLERQITNLENELEDSENLQEEAEYALRQIKYALEKYEDSIN